MVKLARQTIALALLLAFTAGHTALLPALLASGAWLDDDHAVRLVSSGGHLDVVLSHHDGTAHVAEPAASFHHEHQHGWTAQMLVAMAAAPSSGDGDHVIHLLLGGQVTTERALPRVPSASTMVALAPPTAHLVVLAALPVTSPVAAARPPTVSQLLLALRTTVLVV